MKSKTIWIICLVLIIISSFSMDFLNYFIGLIFFGVSAYMAGAYHIKYKLEDG